MSLVGSLLSYVRKFPSKLWLRQKEVECGYTELPSQEGVVGFRLGYIQEH